MGTPESAVEAVVDPDVSLPANHPAHIMMNAEMHSWRETVFHRR
ncbi:hypothetical protein ABIA39_007120 [Nocardia sp. GAS34]